MRAQTLRAVRCQKNAAFHLPHVTRLIVAMGVRNHIGLRSTVSPEPIQLLGGRWCQMESLSLEHEYCVFNLRQDRRPQPWILLDQREKKGEKGSSQ